MNVRLNKTRQHRAAGGVNYLINGVVTFRDDIGDATIPNQDVTAHDGIAFVHRHDGAAFDENCLAHEFKSGRADYEWIREVL
jgi:hypothetical protein